MEELRSTIRHQYPKHWCCAKRLRMEFDGKLLGGMDAKMDVPRYPRPQNEDGEDEEGSSSSDEEEEQVVQTYTLVELTTNCPDGVKPFEKEKHLALEEFERLFGVDQARFYEYPKWKQHNMKRDVGLH